MVFEKNFLFPKIFYYDFTKYKTCNVFFLETMNIIFLNYKNEFILMYNLFCNIYMIL